MTISKEQRDVTKDIREYVQTFHAKRCLECKTPLQDCDNCLASGIVSEVLADRCWLITDSKDINRIAWKIIAYRNNWRPVLPIVREE